MVVAVAIVAIVAIVAVVAVVAVVAIVAVGMAGTLQTTTLSIQKKTRLAPFVPPPVQRPKKEYEYFDVFCYIFD